VYIDEGFQAPALISVNIVDIRQSNETGDRSFDMDPFRVTPHIHRQCPCNDVHFNNVNPDSEREVIPELDNMVVLTEPKVHQHISALVLILPLMYWWCIFLF